MKINLCTWIAVLITSIQIVDAEPPRRIPFKYFAQYTMGGRVEIKDWYFNNSYPQSEPLVYTTNEISQNLELVKLRYQNYYGATDTYLYNMLDKYRIFIEQKQIGVIGSTIPWYESIVLAYSGIPITIDYNKIICEDPRLASMTVEEYRKNPIQFDSLLSISSIEHDGLGRYGDPLNPNGDIRAMNELKDMLKDGGLLFLAVPVGKDCIYWNAHRVYGSMRLPLLLDGWEIVDSCGFSFDDFLVDRNSGHQPVFVLRKTK